MPNNIYNNLSDQDLEKGYWYVSHKVLLRKIFVVTLSVIAIIFIGYGVLGLVKFYLVDRSARLAIENSLGQPKLNQELLAEVNNPQDLQIFGTEIVSAGEGSYDLVTEVLNPNAKWYVESFDYYYLIEEEQSTVNTNYILPGQTKYVLELNYLSDQKFNDADLIIENIKWKKVFDYEALAAKQLLFDFEEAQVLSSEQSGLSDQGSVASVRFDIINKSSYNYWEPQFIVLLYKRDSLVGVTRILVDGLNSGEKKTENVNLFQTVPLATDISIIPDINILDPDVFKGFGTKSSGLN